MFIVKGQAIQEELFIFDSTLEDEGNTVLQNVINP